MSGQEFPELACYGLAGRSASPRDVLDEVRLAERLGIGSMLLSERFNAKDAGVFAAASRSIGIGTAATNRNGRHPLVTATIAVTAHRLSGGRYALGLGGGFGALFEVMGLSKVTGGQLRDVVALYRRLWRGEAALDHDGPAGKYPYLQQDPNFDEGIPVMLAAIGDRTLELAGEIADGVVLHSFLADDALARAVRVIRFAAERAGRDPTSVRVWSVLVTVPEPMPPERPLRRLTGRLATYLQGYGEAVVRANGWDPGALRAFRDDPMVRESPGPSTRSPPRSSWLTCTRCSRRNGSTPPRSAVRAGAPNGSAASSPPEPAESCCTALNPPNSPMSSTRGARSGTRRPSRRCRSTRDGPRDRTDRRR